MSTFEWRLTTRGTLRAEPQEPRTRIGMCCGKRCPVRGFDVPLFLVSPTRYRCGRCYRKETGKRA